MRSRALRANAFLTGAILSEVVATLSLKASAEAPALVLVVAAGYAASFALLAATLRNGKGIGAAYGVWGASGVVLTAIASRFLFGETITPVMAIGFVLIAVGVCVVEVGADRFRRREPRASSGGAERAGSA